MGEVFGWSREDTFQLRSTSWKHAFCVRERLGGGFVCTMKEGGGSVLVSQNRAACTHSLGEEFKGLLRCVCRGGRGEQQMEISWKKVNERVYTVFGSKFDLSKFVFKGSSRIFGEGFHVEVVSEAKERRGGWLFERSSCFTVSKQLPLKMFEFI